MSDRKPDPTPDGEGDDGVLLWHCPTCGRALTVTADRHYPKDSAFWKWRWECRVCRSAWVEDEFALATGKRNGDV